VLPTRYILVYISNSVDPCFVLELHWRFWVNFWLVWIMFCCGHTC